MQHHSWSPLDIQFDKLYTIYANLFFYKLCGFCVLCNEKITDWNQQNGFTIILEPKIFPAQCTILAAICIYYLWIFDIKKILWSVVPAELLEFWCYSYRYAFLAVIKQFLSDVSWGDLGYQIIDTTPGVKTK